MSFFRSLKSVFGINNIGKELEKEINKSALIRKRVLEVANKVAALDGESSWFILKEEPNYEKKKSQVNNAKYHGVNANCLM